jgi:hypothetical protein
MAFGKRNIDKQLEEPSHGEHVDPSQISPWAQPRTWDPATLSRLLVISVAGVVMLAGISALFFIQPGRGEPIEVEAELIDGTQVSASSQGRVTDMCIDQALMIATRGSEPSEDQRPRIARACGCTVSGVVDQLSPLQMQMVFVDYRTTLRATLAEIDRTGESVVAGGMPKLNARDGVPTALVAAASFQSQWREARGLVSQQSARCSS